MPEPSYTERLRAAAQRIADKINNSSAGKAVDKAFTRNPEGGAHLSVYDVGDARAKEAGQAAAPKVDQEKAKAAIEWLARKPAETVKPAAKALWDVTGTPRAAVEAVRFGFSPEAYNAHQKELAVQEELARRKRALTSGN